MDIHDLFDILEGDQENKQEDKDGERDNVLEEYYENFDFDYLHTNVDEEEIPIMLVKKTMPSVQEEDDKGCKRPLSTPSTTPSTPTTTILKQIRTDQYEEPLPTYLQITNTLLDQINIRINTKDLQELLRLKHRIAVLQLDEELWNAFKKFGTGQWITTISERTITTAVDRRVWFDEVKKKCIESINSRQKLWETTIDEYLVQLNNDIEHYRHEFEQKQMQLQLDGTEIHIEEHIDAFIAQHGMPVLRDEFNYKINLFEYDYDIELLQREYIQEKASADQIQLAQYLLSLKTKCTESQLELLEIKQCILRQQQQPIPSISSRIPDPNIDLIDESDDDDDDDGLIGSILRVEKSIRTYEQLFDEQLTRNQSLPGKLIRIIFQFFKIIDKKLRYMYDHKMNSISTNKSMIIPSVPSFIIDTPLRSHGLSHRQLQLLNRGPTYIPPFQMYIQSTTTTTDRRTFDHEQLQKQYRYIQQHLIKFYTKFNINPAHSMFINRDIKDLYTSTFAAVLLPDNFYQRAIYENQLVDSIREHCRTNDLILKRLANQTNVFYLGNRLDFQQKVDEYLSQKNIFEMCEIVDDNKLQQTYNYLENIIRTINEQFDYVLKKKKNYKDLIKKIFVDKSKVRLPYLYFLPEITQTKGLSVKPIVVARKSATSRLASFLDQLLRPAIQRHEQSTAFIDGTDFIRKLDEFSLDKKRFNTNTNFVTITIKNLEFMYPHGQLLTTLQEYLNENLATGFIENISINEIIHLTALFLHHTRVYYDHKIYRFLKGSPSSCSLTETLSNISAYQWQKNILLERSIMNELYGRCQNRIFFTWNDTIDKFKDFIYKLATRYPDLPLDVTMGTSSHFLNVSFENRNGTLYTNVYHDNNTCQYALPYAITNPKDVHSHWLRSALIRAVRYCTHVNDFNRERIHLEIACLSTGYPLEFFEERLQHFYIHFDAQSLRTSLDQKIYNRLRHRLFNFISEQKTFSKTKKDLENTNRRIELNYPYEYGPKHVFNRKLRHILIENSEPLPTTTMSSSHSNNQKQLKVFIRTKQQYSLNALLTEQKPNHPLVNENNMLF